VPKGGAIGLAVLLGSVGGAIVAAHTTGDDPSVPRSRASDGASSLFIQPGGTDLRACGDYIATWLDLLHAEDEFPINELKADLGQGPLWVAVTDTWSSALELESTMSQEEAAARLVPTIDAACRNPNVRAQFLQLPSN
jgi:hypothetical protein